MKFTGAEISHRLIAGENKEQLEVTENKILDVTGQHMLAWEAESKSPEQLRGTNGKLFQNILYNGNTIPCYQMVIILLQFIQTIFIQIWNQLTQILWFPMNQLDSELQNEFKD